MWLRLNVSGSALEEVGTLLYNSLHRGVGGDEVPDVRSAAHAAYKRIAAALESQLEGAKTMNEKIAKIESTMLGVEDHGIWTCYLTVNYGGSGQSIGGRALDEPIYENGKFVERRGTAYGMEWVRRIVAACGVNSWEKVKGRTIMVYVESEDFNARPIGIGPLPTEPGKPFMFDSLRELAEEPKP